MNEFLNSLAAINFFFSRIERKKECGKMIELTMTGNENRKFNLGDIYLTKGVFEECNDKAGFYDFVTASVEKHSKGDWGNLSEQDKKENEFSLEKYLRILSAYYHPMSGKKIWVLTEADRSITTVLFPEEY